MRKSQKKGSKLKKLLKQKGAVRQAVLVAEILKAPYLLHASTENTSFSGR